MLLDVMPNRVGMPAIEPEFLQAIRDTTREVGALLVLDEVISFRLGHGGAQTKLGIDPDITTLAKIIGGGLPGGRHRRPPGPPWRPSSAWRETGPRCHRAERSLRTPSP